MSHLHRQPGATGPQRAAEAGAHHGVVALYSAQKQYNKSNRSPCNDINVRGSLVVHHLQVIKALLGPDVFRVLVILRAQLEEGDDGLVSKGERQRDRRLHE